MARFRYFTLNKLAKICAAGNDGKLIFLMNVTLVGERTEIYGFGGYMKVEIM